MSDALPEPLPDGPLRGPLRKRESSLWAREPDDWYVEPAWCAERLFDVEPFLGRIWDPACGLGTIVAAAQAAGYAARGFDRVRRSAHCIDTIDFLGQVITAGENIVSNPPFRLADPDPRRGRRGFVELALERAAFKVAMLLPANWARGDRRSRWLETTPLYRVWFLTPRPSMPPGHVIAAGGKPGNGTTDYAWFVWLKGFDGAPTLRWLRREP